ncbi:MAG: trigger factor [Clostridiales bacterium]|nr:trigger factor [Clostridiales bacterium]
MKATFIEKQDAKVKFELEYTAEEFEAALIDAYKLMKDQFRIDGFRKGKAPRKLIMQHYGEHVFDDDAIEGLLQKDYPAALLELGIEPVCRPEVDFPEIKHGEGFVVKIEVETPPEFDVKDYEGVKIESVSYPASDEDVEKQLEQAQNRGMRLVESDGEAGDGDTVNIDYSGSIDGVKFDGGTDAGHNLKLGSGAFIEGFEEQLLGKKAGDEVDVKVTFPDEYHADTLAGKEAVFAVKVNEVRVEEKPELNDEFAQDISEFDTLDELRADIKTKLAEQGVLRAEMEMKDAILQKIYEANDIDVPTVMVDDQLEDMLKEFEQGVKQQGFKLEQYFQMTGQVPNELRERIKEDAYKRVKTKLIVQNIARLQGFEASEEEVEDELAKMAEQYGMEKEKLRDVLGEFQIKLLKDDIKNKKAVDYIYANAITGEA